MRGVRGVLVLASVLVLTASGGAAAQQQMTAIRNVQLFDGYRLIRRATLVMQNGRILGVGENIRAPAGSRLVDGTGRTLLPGFIDGHTHTRSRADLRTAVALGVTTQLDMMTPPDSLRAWRKIAGVANLFSAGAAATVPGGHGTQFGPTPTLTKPDEAAEFVNARVREGSDWIKIIVDDGSLYGLSFATLDTLTVRALIRAAHAKEKLAVVHVATLASARAAVRAGADGLVHVWQDSVPDEAFVRELVAKKIFVIPTLTVVESVVAAPGGAALVQDTSLAPYLMNEARARLATTFPKNPASRASYEVARASVALMAKRGVQLIAGSDAPNPGTTYGASLHRELELLVAAGLEPMDALKAATSTPGTAFKLSYFGRIEQEGPADLILVEGDPTTDITATRHIVDVWKDGLVVDRASYRAEVAAANAQAGETAASTPGFRGVISTFDDRTASAVLGRSWVSNTDAFMGGKSTAQIKAVEGGAGGTPAALQITGEVMAAVQYPFAGVIWFPAAQPMSPADLSGGAGLRFLARGDGGTYNVMVFTRKGGQMPAVRTFPAGAEWQEHAFAWSDFNTDGRDVAGVVIAAGPKPGPFSLVVDQVEVR